MNVIYKIAKWNNCGHDNSRSVLNKYNLKKKVYNSGDIQIPWKCQRYYSFIKSAPTHRGLYM